MTDLFHQLFLGTTAFTYNEIDSQRNQTAYWTAVQNLSLLYSLDTPFSELRRIIEDGSRKDKDFGWALFGNPKSWAALPYRQALEIVDSLETRFIKGYTSPYVFTKPRRRFSFYKF